MTASFKIDAEHPWPWLDAFPEYAERFFNGRDDEKAALFRCVLSAPVTVLFGKSGLGKSSLLQAGLFPQLRGERLLPVYVRLLHDQNAPEICAQLAKRFSEEIHKTQSPGAASPPLHYRYRQSREDEDAEPIILTDDLWADLHRSDIELVDETGKRWQPVFVLDQFEEIFTLGGQNPNRQTHCFYQLGDLLENRIPKTLAERLNQDDELFDQLNPDSQAYRFLLSLREDYLPDLEEWSELIPRLSSNRFRLLSMTAPQAVAAVEKTGGGLVTHQDAENIVHYLSASQAAGPHKRRGGTQIEPALLGLMCAGLNDDRLRTQKSRLKTDNLNQEGGLIVERFYDQAFTNLPASVRDFVEQHLITADGVRLAYPVRSMETEKLATAAQLNTLVDKRLLRRESLEEGDRIELVHDRLAQVALQRRKENAQRRELQMQQKKRLRWLVGFAGLLLLVTLFAAYLWQAESKAKQAWMEATATRLAIEGSSITSGLRQGSTTNGLLKVLAGHRLARAANGGETLLDEALQTEYLKFKQLVFIRELPAPVTAIAFSPDGKRILSGNKDYSLQLWDTLTGQTIGPPMTGHTMEVNSVAFSPDGKRIVSGSRDGALKIWNIDTGQVVNIPITDLDNSIFTVAYSSDGKLIASGGRENTLRLWDAKTGHAINVPLSGHQKWIFSTSFSPDSRRIVSGSEDNTLRLWDAESGQLIGQPLIGHKNWVVSVAFSPDGKRIVSGSIDKSLLLWDANSGKPIAPPLVGHQDIVSSIAFSHDGRRIVSGSKDKTLRVWNTDTSQPIGPPLTGHQGMVISVAFSSDGKQLFSGSEDNTWRIWKTDTDIKMTGHQAEVSSAAFSPDGEYIVSGSRDGTLRRWHVKTGEAMAQPLTSHKNWIYSVAYSPDGKQIVSSSWDRTLRLWNSETGETIGAPLIGHEDAVYSVVFSPDGKRIASASGDGTIRVWDTQSGRTINTSLNDHKIRVFSSVAFNPSGTQIVSGSWDNTLQLWDADSGQAIGAPLAGHKNSVNCAVFSPDGKRIISGSSDGTLLLWNASTHQPIGGPLIGHQNSVTSVAFSPDGRRVVSGSWDKTLRLWDGETGQPIGQVLTGHSADVNSVAFSPDGKYILSASSDETLRIWPVFEAWADELCKKLDRNMSHKEWREWVSPDIDYIEQCPGLPIPPDQAGLPVKDAAQATTE